MIKHNITFCLNLSIFVLSYIVLVSRCTRTTPLMFYKRRNLRRGGARVCRLIGGGGKMHRRCAASPGKRRSDIFFRPEKSCGKIVIMG